MRALLDVSVLIALLDAEYVHTAGRALSAATRAGVPETDGFLYPSRFTGHLCLALFDKAVRKLEALEVTAPKATTLTALLISSTMRPAR